MTGLPAWAEGLIGVAIIAVALYITLWYVDPLREEDEEDWKL